MANNLRAHVRESSVGHRTRTMRRLMHNAASSRLIVRFSASDIDAFVPAECRPGRRGKLLITEFATFPNRPTYPLDRMNGKADIAFLLNPKAQAQMASYQSPTEGSIATPPATPPPMSLFRSLSPVERFPERLALSFSPTRKVPASYEPVHEKRFSSMRCYGDDTTRLPMLSLAAMYASNNSNFSIASSVASSEQSDEEHNSTSSRRSNPLQGGKTRVRKTHTPPCQVEGCKNLAVSRGCCVRHGGGSRCTVAGCCKRAKLYQRCFQHGGYKTCTEPGCTKKAKRYGHCWSHGGGRICEVPDCTKVSTQGGLCWAHGGGNRCKLEGCSRRSYQKYGYYCVHHSKLSSNVENAYNSSL